MSPRTSWLSILLGCALIGASSCSKSNEQSANSNAAAELPEITAELKQGEGIDLVFAIQEQTLGADGSRILQVRGKYKGAEVGLMVVLGAKWESVKPDPKESFAFHTGTVEFRSIGDPSTGLLKALDELYGTKLGPQAMRAATKFAGASLQGDPNVLAKGEVRLKLSFESTDPERQAELYTNIDLPNHRLRICEKDESYRKAVIQALTQE